MVEILLRWSVLQRLVFDTSLLRLFAFGAVLCYYIGYYLIADRRHRDRILAHEFCGTQ